MICSFTICGAGMPGSTGANTVMTGRILPSFVADTKVFDAFRGHVGGRGDLTLVAHLQAAPVEAADAA